MTVFLIEGCFWSLCHLVSVSLMLGFEVGCHNIPTCVCMNVSISLMLGFEVGCHNIPTCVCVNVSV